MSWLSNLFGKKKEDEKNAKTFAKWADSLEKIAEAQVQILDIMKGKSGEPKEDKPFSVKCILTNNTLMAIFQDGEIYSCIGDKDLFDAVSKVTSKEEARLLMYPDVVEEEIKNKKRDEITAQQKQEELNKQKKELEKEVEKAEKVKQHVGYLISSGEFELINDVLYMCGIPLGIPQLLVNKFVDLVDKVYNGVSEKIDEYEAEYKALKNFWMWTSLCPNPQSREDMFKFLKQHDLKVNKHGFFFAYRKVNTVENTKVDSSYVVAISAFKTQVKTWKKSPVNYDVYLDGSNYLLKDLKKNRNVIGKCLGNLAKLYANLSSEENGQSFTDERTGTMDIRIGKAVSMPREECDSNNNNECSRGLHIGNKLFGFSGFGDTNILVLINPMNAVSIPSYDSNKMRVCEYYPVSVIPGGEDNMVKFLEDKNVLELGDEYFLDEISKLEKLVKNNTPKELGDKKILSPEQTKASLVVIEEAFSDEVKVLKINRTAAKEAVKNRVKVG